MVNILVSGVIYELIPVHVRIVKMFKDRNGNEESAYPVDSAMTTNSELIM